VVTVVGSIAELATDGSNTAIVANGVVTPHGAGTAIVTVTVAGGTKTASCVVTVSN
jgi:uncharacterized protein YjdB